MERRNSNPDFRRESRNIFDELELARRQSLSTPKLHNREEEGDIIISKEDSFDLEKEGDVCFNSRPLINSFVYIIFRILNYILVKSVLKIKLTLESVYLIIISMMDLIIAKVQEVHILDSNHLLVVLLIHFTRN